MNPHLLNRYYYRCRKRYNIYYIIENFLLNLNYVYYLTRWNIPGSNEFTYSLNKMYLRIIADKVCQLIQTFQRIRK